MRGIQFQKTICSMCGKVYEARLLMCPFCEFINLYKIDIVKKQKEKKRTRRDKR